jgi:redox-sensing transcriptional repressor
MTREIQGNTEKISEFTVRRLSNYFRILRELEKKDVTTVSSARLAELGGITSAQVRKDLSYFGNFGTRGLGYKVTELRDAVVRILGLNHRWGMALFGAGSLGHALFFHNGFREDGFYFTHVYDVDGDKIGTLWESAQEVVDLMARVGVKGVLNFAPQRLDLPDNMWLRNVNLAVALESLSFYLSL